MENDFIICLSNDDTINNKIINKIKEMDDIRSEGYIVIAKHIVDFGCFYSIGKKTHEQPCCYNDEITTVFKGEDYILEELSDRHEHIAREFSFYDNPTLMLSELYSEFGIKILDDFQSLDSCAFCIYDESNENFIVTRVKTEVPVYFGNTDNNTLLFSNNMEILLEFCANINEMPEDSLYKNGELYSIHNRNIKLSQSENSSKANLLLETTTNELIKLVLNNFKEKTEKIVDSYSKTINLSDVFSEQIKQDTINYITKKTLETFKEELESSSILPDAYKKVEEQIDEMISNKLKEVTFETTKIINLPNIIESKKIDGVFHEKYEDVLTCVSLDEPVMLIGPAGSGKNVAVEQISKALEMPMYYTNNANNEFKLTGFVDAGGNYRERPFYKAFKNGGIFFLDEMDNSDPSALIVMNSALANGYMDFPHETVEKHKDFRMVAAANTWGNGSDLQYVGRNTLDASTLDRFDNIFFDYDRKMERLLYPNDEVLEFMWGFRDSVLKNRILHIVSTRGIGKVYKKHINGVPIPLILTTNILKGLSEDDINIILGEMSVSDSNCYMKEVKTLTKVLQKDTPIVNTIQNSIYPDDELPF